MEQYDFSWNQLGNVELGRPNLGSQSYVIVHRLFQYTLKAVLQKEYGEEQTRKLLYQAGVVAGKEFCKNLLDTSLPFNKFIAQLHHKLIELAIGILRVEKSDSENLSLIITISEDLDCSGLPVSNTTLCNFDEGMIEGIFSEYTGHSFTVIETDCWSTGDRTCRFSIEQKK